MSYLVLGLSGLELSEPERRWLAHPLVTGAIVFARSWSDPDQMLRLTAEVRHCAGPQALLMVDQEGGRVQRFGAPLTELPALGRLGQRYDKNPAEARQLAADHGELMAAEVLSLGLDLSLSPILDLDAGSQVIGDRALHRDPAVVADLSSAYRAGMARAGMAACGKHFPGHGTVTPDTHHADAEDPRSLNSLLSQDLSPFAAAIDDQIQALMLAHVCYPAVCDQPAGYSQRWISHILRNDLGFQGVVISDDLGMRAAHRAGTLVDRVQASLTAGCDLLLVCQPEEVAEIMAAAGAEKLPVAQGTNPRVAALRGSPAPGAERWSDYKDSPRRAELRSQLKCLI